MQATDALADLEQLLEGELHFDRLLRTLYATDASVYRELPLAVAYPKHSADIRQLILFARQHQLSLIPRAAGTSLAGQCVGQGIVVDISRHMTRILEVNVSEGWVRVQPGVIRDELNAFLRPNGLFFGPNTSTANRCMMGGMVGNNSCGSTSIVYGTTREHVLQLSCMLSDGSEVEFGALSEGEFVEKMKGEGLENKLYRHIHRELSPPEVREAIEREFPDPAIHRRNTGYAVDLLLRSQPFSPQGEPFNFCKLLCGSEGTLAFTTEIRLHVDPLPQPIEVLACPHFHSIQDCLHAVQVAMQYAPTACEMMDKIILDCTKANREQEKNRFFLEGDPEALLMIEFRGDSLQEARDKATALHKALEAKGLGYAFPIVEQPLTQRVWDLRKAGLGLLANIPGDPKAVACIEDTAVALPDLPAYIDDFIDMMAGFDQRAVIYAHAGAGELHLRPILNLKKSEGIRQFREISEASARLVKKYRGSLSGEHGDGRVRAEFLPLMIGEDNYQLLRRLKAAWDPQGIFNPGKITDAPPMDQSLRYPPDVEIPEIETTLDFSASGGMLRAAEKCNGSGDCRKLSLSGGTMCPSYRATREEKTTTRARANSLREFLRKQDAAESLDFAEVKEVLDLCLSCKGCLSECPSNVDMASLKAEFLHQYYQHHRAPFRSRAIANTAQLFSLAAIFPRLSNFFFTNSLTSSIGKKVAGIAPQRALPTVHRHTLRSWFKKQPPLTSPKGKVWFFCDEFTNYNDTPTGIKAVQLLNRLGYQVQMIAHPESGRSHISKGFLGKAKRLATKNVELFHPIVSAEQPLLGLEPSALLSFRDEYPRLVPESLRSKARELAPHALLIEEFLVQEIEKGRLGPEAFTTAPRQIKLHGHCHQKALGSVESSRRVLSLPENYQVEVIPSGCCGMAGSFGYEKEHFELSMQVGELVLFPAVRKAAAETLIAAPGTSCRHQIMDGTGRQALHPIEILLDALL